MAAHLAGEPLVAHRAGALRVDEDARRLGHADRVAQLHLAHLREARGDDVLGDVARHVRGAAVDLRRVLAAERAAAVAAAAAVGVDDDLAAGEAAVAVRAADLELAGRVDVHGDAVVPPLAEDRLDDVLDDLGLQLLLAGRAVPRGVMLRGEDDGVDPLRREAVVLDGDLALGVRAQALDDALLAHVRLALHELVRERDGERHELRRLAAGEAEHHALVARALAVDAHGDVRALAAEHHAHAAALPVEALERVVVAGLAHRGAHDVGDVHGGLGGHLAGDDREARGHQRLARHAAHRVLREDRVEDRVADLVGELVGVAHRDGLAGEQVALVVHGHWEGAPESGVRPGWNPGKADDAIGPGQAAANACNAGWGGPPTQPARECPTGRGQGPGNR